MTASRVWLRRGAMAAAVGALQGTAACGTGEVIFLGGGSSATGGDAGAGGEGGTGGAANPCGIDCRSIGTEPCHVGICDEDRGRCVVIAADDGTACDDGLFCTTADRCAAGDCVGSEDNDCNLPASPCEKVLCHEATSSCSIVSTPDGASCLPADPCLINATCQSGVCIGEPRNCMYAPVPSDCHVSECNSATGQCEPRIGNEGGDCASPTDPCQVGGTCHAGICEDPSPKDCSQLTDPTTCTVGVCDPSSGYCDEQTIPDGAPCEDLDGCTFNEVCDNGVCAGTGVIVGCIDGDDCCPTSCSIANDDDCAPFGTFCQWPIDVSAVSFPHTVNETFDDDPSTGSTCDVTPTNAVWFAYQASTTGQHTIALANASTTLAYSRVGVFDGTGCDPLGTQIGCDTASSKTIQIIVSLTAGHEYLILFHTDGNVWTMVQPTISITPS